MADQTYDAIIIGAGAKGLTLAMYLAKYGGMEVALFEKKHETGGGWFSDESPAPGFIADHCATGVSAGYHFAVSMDFPEWEELGGKDLTIPVGMGMIFKEDDSCIVFYTRKADPTYEKTVASISRFSIPANNSSVSRALRSVILRISLNATRLVSIPAECSLLARAIRVT